MLASNWVPELVDYAGGMDPLGEAGKHSGYLGVAGEILGGVGPLIRAALENGLTATCGDLSRIGLLSLP